MLPVLLEVLYLLCKWPADYTGCLGKCRPLPRNLLLQGLEERPVSLHVKVTCISRFNRPVV